MIKLFTLMSRPSSGLKKNSNYQKSQNNLIIIQKERAGSEPSNNLIIIEKGNFKAKSNIEQNINKTKINKKINEIEKTILMMNNNSKKVDYIQLKSKINPSEYSENNTNNKNPQNDKELMNSFTINENEEKRTKIIANLQFETNSHKEVDNNSNMNNDNQLKYYDSEENIENLDIRKFTLFNTITFDSTNMIYKSCWICDRTFPSYKLIYINCNIHLICNKCFKSYYEEKIEEGEKDFKCPIYSCNGYCELNKKKLESLISPIYLNLMTKNDTNSIYSNDLLSDDPALKLHQKYKIISKSNEKLELYTNKHVIDINSNENFFMYNKIKEQFCPFCNKKSLFSKTGTHFIKCLNCLNKICKYCFKHFTDLHMDISNESHCKIYYRQKAIVEKKNNYCLLIFLEIFMLFASFYLLISSGFLYIKRIVKCVLCLKKEKEICCLLNIIIFFFTFIFFLILFPILLIGFPYFPIFISIFGF